MCLCPSQALFGDVEYTPMSLGERDRGGESSKSGLGLPMCPLPVGKPPVLLLSPLSNPNSQSELGTAAKSLTNTPLSNKAPFYRRLRPERLLAAFQFDR